MKIKLLTLAPYSPRAGAGENRASLRAGAIKKIVFILSPFFLVVQNCDAFLFIHQKSQREKCSRACAGSFISFRLPLWNASNAFYHKSFPLSLPPEPPHRATYPRRLDGENWEIMTMAGA